MRHFCTCLLHSPTPAEWVDPPLVRACALPPFIFGDFSLSLAPLSCLARRDRPAGGSGLALARCSGCQGARDFFLFSSSRVDGDSSSRSRVGLSFVYRVCFVFARIYIFVGFFESLTDSQQPICQPRKYFLDVFWRLSTARRPGRVKNLVARVWTIYLSLSVGCG